MLPPTNLLKWWLTKLRYKPIKTNRAEEQNDIKFRSWRPDKSDIITQHLRKN